MDESNEHILCCGKDGKADCEYMLWTSIDSPTYCTKKDFASHRKPEENNPNINAISCCGQMWNCDTCHYQRTCEWVKQHDTTIRNDLLIKAIALFDNGNYNGQTVRAMLKTLWAGDGK